MSAVGGPDPGQLLRAASSLRHDADRLADERALVRGETTDLLAAAHGAAPDALAQQLRSFDRPLAEQEEQLRRVAAVLERQATLAAVLEEAVARVQFLLDGSFAAQRALTGLATLGRALDVICAREIERICTPELDEPLRRMADLPDLSADDLHEINLLEAPPPVQALADAHPDLRLLESVDGGLVAAVGDLETAETVTTFVAGVGSTDPGGWSTQIDRTRDLAAAAAPSGRGAAGIVWLGYHAPPSVPHALQRAPAKTAGRELAAFQRELARRYPRQRRVVAGFSYGGVVVGAAARSAAGLHADEVVFIASPGVGAVSVDQFTLHGEDPRVHAMVSRGDPIGLTTGPGGGIHGPDPTDPGFGARVWDPGVTGDHAIYFRDPAFLAAFGAAVQAPESGPGRS